MLIELRSPALLQCHFYILKADGSQRKRALGKSRPFFDLSRSLCGLLMGYGRL